MKVIVIGAGGQARTVASILRCYPDIEIECFIDKKVRGEGETICGAPVKEDFSLLQRLFKKGVSNAVIAIGDNSLRGDYAARVRKMGFNLINAVHPSAIIAAEATLGKGVVVAAGAIICPFAQVGNNTIVNTGAIVEHEVKLGDNVHVAPGANVAGRVTIGRNSFIGIGATVKDYVTIGQNVTVGAGSVVLTDVPDNKVVAGVPAKPIRKK